MNSQLPVLYLMVDWIGFYDFKADYIVTFSLQCISQLWGDERPAWLGLWGKVNCVPLEGFSVLSATPSILICVVLWTQAKRVIPSSITVSVTLVLMAGPVRIEWMDITVIVHLVSNKRKLSGFKEAQWIEKQDGSFHRSHSCTVSYTNVDTHFILWHHFSCSVFPFSWKAL